MSKEQLYIFDTTLRDGAQTQGVDFSIDDKEKISSALDKLGVDYVEGGWPGANPTDTEFFNKDHNFKSTKLTAFGMTKKSEHSAENDPMLSSLINSKSTSVCLFGKSWDFQVDVALGISNEQNLTNISESKENWLKFKISKALISEKEILKKIQERNNARENKNYEEADKIRNELLDKGVLIEDKDGKTTWKFK